MTLDVNGVASTVTKADGMRAPRITLAQLNAKTGYNSNHVGALLYVTDITGGSTVSATAQIATVGYYYFDGTAWQSVVAKTGTAVLLLHWEAEMVLQQRLVSIPVVLRRFLFQP